MATELEYKAAVVGLKDATDQVKKMADQTATEIKNLGRINEETKAAADQALIRMNEMNARVDEIEQKLARRGGGEQQDGYKSHGRQFVESDQVKAMMARGAHFRGSVSLEMKAVTSASASGSSASTALVVADRQPGIVQVIPNQEMTIRDLLMPGETSSASIEYVRETLFTNNAAPVAENPSTPKPQSDMTFDLKNLPVRTVAHWVKASKQILSDAPMLQSYIDGRLRYGLQYVEQQQLLLGDGTGNNLLGLMPQATTYAQPSGVTVTGATMIDKIRLAMLQATLAQFPATGHVFHPTDWASIELTKDGQGRYLLANPTGLATPVLWGLPVVQSLAMPQNSFLTGAFKYAAQLFDRETINVTVSTEDQDNFVKNMVTILAEERLGLAVYRPQALIKGTFATGS